jgi:hypothetical protein
MSARVRLVGGAGQAKGLRVERSAGAPLVAAEVVRAAGADPAGGVGVVGREDGRVLVRISGSDGAVLVDDGVAPVEVSGHVLGDGRGVAALGAEQDALSHGLCLS